MINDIKRKINVICEGHDFSFHFFEYIVSEGERRVDMPWWNERKMSDDLIWRTIWKRFRTKRSGM